MSREYLAVTGLAKSGKSEIVKHIVADFGFSVIKPSLIISQELQKEKNDYSLRFSREQLRAKGEELRSLYGPAYYLDMVDNLGNRVLIDGPRHKSSIDQVLRRGGFTIGIVASAEIRWQRALSVADKIVPNSLAKFMDEERLELNDITGRGGQILPILWNLDPQNIIDTSEISIEQSIAEVDDIMQRRNINKRS